MSAPVSPATPAPSPAKKKGKKKQSAKVPEEPTTPAPSMSANTDNVNVQMDNYGELYNLVLDMSDRLTRVEDRQEPGSRSPRRKGRKGDAVYVSDSSGDEDTPKGRGARRRRHHTTPPRSSSRRRHAGKRSRRDTSSSDSSSEEETRRTRKGKVSGRDTTAANIVKVKAQWPHHEIFLAGGKPAKYNDLTLPMFCRGYTSKMNSQNSHLRNLMSEHLIRLMKDADKHDWEDVKAYHGVFLQHVEAGRTTWEDSEFRQELRHDMLVDRQRKQQAPRAPPHPQQQRYGRDANSNALPPAPPGTTACPAFQAGTCQQHDSHGKMQHICDFCLKITRRMFHHPQSECRIKAGLAGPAKN
jgi:hypothetical protein